MVTIGADLHKRSHTVVAVDDNGRRLAERSLSATPAGHLELLAQSVPCPAHARPDRLDRRPDEICGLCDRISEMEMKCNDRALVGRQTVEGVA